MEKTVKDAWIIRVETIKSWAGQNFFSSFIIVVPAHQFAKLETFLRNTYFCVILWLWLLGMKFLIEVKKREHITIKMKLSSYRGIEQSIPEAVVVSSVIWNVRTAEGFF